MPRVAALCASLLCACSFPGAPTLLPPPFGPDPARPEPARLFFPTGIAIDPTSRDRKSTRLNSSHVKISYAVFCLKKKKKYHNIIKVIQNKNNSINKKHKVK